jgi:hypothetical protein
MFVSFLNVQPAAQRFTSHFDSSVQEQLGLEVQGCLQPLEAMGQGKQCERPDTLANVPAAQHAHSTWPIRAVALPAPQGAHVMLPAVE